MKNLFAGKRKLWILLLILPILSLAGAFGIGYLLKPDPNLLMVVGSEKIYKKDLNEKYYGVKLSGDVNDSNLGSELGIDEKQRNYFLDLLVEESILKQKAQGYGISVTDVEVEEKSKTDIKEWDILSEQQKNVARTQTRMNILRDKIQNQVVTWKKGRYVEVRFDRHFTVPESLSDEEKQKRGATQVEDVKKDREYADKLKDDLYTKLTNGTISFDQAKEIVLNDKYIDYLNWDYDIHPPAIDYDTLNSPDSSNLLEQSGFREALPKTAKGKISEPFLRQLDYGDYNTGEVKYRDSMWVILVVDDEHQGEANSLRGWFDSQKQILGVKSYVNGYGSTKKISKSGTVFAYNPTACSSGYSGQGASYPGDFISEIRMLTASGANVPVAGSYSYLRHGDSRAYAYSGCPLLSKNVTVGSYTYEATESSDGNGCMYYYSHLRSTHKHTCCSGYHNPHQWKVGKAGTLETKGYWYIRYSAYSYGSAWGGPYSGEFSTGYGERYSDPGGDGVNFTVHNGDTVYLRAYWKVDPDTPPVITPGPSLARNTALTTASSNFTLQATTTDPGASETVNALLALTKSTDNGATYGGWSYYSTGQTTQGLKNITTLSPATLGLGKYKWVVCAVDQYNTYNATPPGSPNCYNHNDPWFFTIGPPTVDAHLNVSANIPGVATMLIDGTAQATKNYNTTTSAQSYTASFNITNSNYEFANWTGANCPTGTFAAGSTETRTCTANFRLKGLSCNVTPQDGLSPLVVMVSFNGGLPNYSLDMGDGTTLTNRVSPVYYTYSTDGDYTVTVRDSASPPTACPVAVKVNKPSTYDGGEVAP